MSVSVIFRQTGVGFWLVREDDDPLVKPKDDKGDA